MRLFALQYTALLFDTFCTLRTILRIKFPVRKQVVT